MNANDSEFETVARMRGIRMTRRLNEWESLEYDRAITVLAEEYESIASKAVNRLASRGTQYRQLLEEQKESILQEAIWRYSGNDLKHFGRYAKAFVRNKLIKWLNLHGGVGRHTCDRNRQFNIAKDELSQELQQRPTNEEAYSRLGWSPAICKHHNAITTNEFLWSSCYYADSDAPAIDCRKREWVEREIQQLAIGEILVLRSMYLTHPRRSVSETATAFGMSEFQVEELRRSAIKRLKKRLKVQRTARLLLTATTRRS